MTAWSRRALLRGGLALPVMACGDRPPRASEPDALRVASQTVLSDEVLWDLGPAAQGLVVAVSAMADDTRYCRIAGRWPASIPRAAGTSEALLALVPTLVIIAAFTAAETRRLLEQAGLRTLVLEAFDGFDDYRANVRAIARAVELPADGERLVAEFDARLDALRRGPPGSGPRILSWNEGSVPGAGTTFDDVATAAGYRNVPTLEGRAGHLQIAVEQLVAWDPDVIVVPCGDADCDRAAEALAERPGVRATRAARRGTIIGVPSRALYSTGAAMLDVVERLAEARAETTP
ncbi:MAG: ABC transporter substrate-binding protein [Myxococcales bacterium]|nr:ABC transporter substrate-binding protein [Myxococcales bacterium]